MVEHVDKVVYATGYVYSFPFLDEANVVSIEDNRWNLLPWQMCSAGQLVDSSDESVSVDFKCLETGLSGRGTIQGSPVHQCRQGRHTGSAMRGFCGCCRVGPLYQHIWPPRHSPRLSFVGLPWKASLQTLIFL